MQGLVWANRSPHGEVKRESVKSDNACGLLCWCTRAHIPFSLSFWAIVQAAQKSVWCHITTTVISLQNMVILPCKNSATYSQARITPFMLCK